MQQNCSLPPLGWCLPKPAPHRDPEVPQKVQEAHCPVSTRAGILSFSRVAAFCPLPLSGLQPAAQCCMFCDPSQGACMMMYCAPKGGANF